MRAGAYIGNSVVAFPFHIRVDAQVLARKGTDHLSIRLGHAAGVGPTLPQPSTSAQTDVAPTRAPRRPTTRAQRRRIVAAQVLAGRVDLRRLRLHLRLPRRAAALRDPRPVHTPAAPAHERVLARARDHAPPFPRDCRWPRRLAALLIGEGEEQREREYRIEDGSMGQVE